MRFERWVGVLCAAAAIGCGGSGAGGGGSSAQAGSGGAGSTSGGHGAGGTTSSGPGGGACKAPVAQAPSLDLANFDDGTIPNSDTGTQGFRGSDVARGTVFAPGANGTAQAVTFDFATDGSTFFQGHDRPVYLDQSSTYHPDLANALSFWIRVPAGSGVLSTSNQTFSIYTYHWKHGDPFVGPNAGANLTDSQMHGYGPLRFDPSAAGQWLHVVMSASAFDHSRGNYHFYAAQAVAEDLTFFGSLRQFQTVVLGDISSGPTTLDFDAFELVTLPPTATVCPPSYASTVPASGGDVLVPVTILNPTSQDRSYRVFVSSVIGVDRETLEGAMHDADDVGAIDALQGAVGSDGSVGASELFEADASGKPQGASIVAQGTDIAIAAGATWSGVVVHHVTPGMLGAATPITYAGNAYTIRHDTLTTSVIVWDPNAPRVGDAAAVFMGSNVDTSHPAPPGFPQYQDPPVGWHSTDVPPDQVAGYFVSVLRLQ